MSKKVEKKVEKKAEIKDHAKDSRTIWQALSDLQYDIPTIERKRTGQIGHIKFKYADLSDIWDKIRTPLRDHGFSIIQIIETVEENDWISTKLIHSSGGEITSRIKISFRAEEISKFGKNITYYRRYALSALLGIVSDEDVDKNLTDQEKDYKKVPKKVAEKKLPMVITHTQFLEMEKLINGHEDIRKSMEEGFGSISEIPADKYEKTKQRVKRLIADKLKKELEFKEGFEASQEGGEK